MFLNQETIFVLAFFLNLVATFDNMKRLGFRAAFLSNGKNAGAGTKPSQPTEPQLFYIVFCQQLYFILINTR